LGNTERIVMKISIVIPTYEAHGRGVEYCKCLFNSIKSQTYTNYEVVVSDHSKDDLVMNEIDNWKDEFDIIYYRNERGRGNNSINMNEGIKRASGEWIKIMHQDDWFCNKNTLKLMKDSLLKFPSYKWGAFGFNHFNESDNKIKREIIPCFEKTMGNPSVSFFENNNNYFDEYYFYLNDHDMTYHLQKKYIKPLIIPDMCITIRVNAVQTTNYISEERKKEEFKYFEEKTREGVLIPDDASNHRSTKMNARRSSLESLYSWTKKKLARRKAKYWVARGEHHLHRGATEKAWRCSRRALSQCEDLATAHVLMAKALFPGDDYLTIISHIHDTLEPQSYVEIGVGVGTSLARAKPLTKVIGIEPRPCISIPIPSRAKLYPIASDDFFASYDLFHELDESSLALAFIDGLHLFDQALKDFANLEKYAGTQTIFLIHDCLPITRLMAAREQVTEYWCGDVWKLLPCLRAYRPDLTVHTIPTWPTGLAVITNLDPNSTVIADKFTQIISEYQHLDLDYDYLDPHRLTAPDMIPNNWQQISDTIFQNA